MFKKMKPQLRFFLKNFFLILRKYRYFTVFHDRLGHNDDISSLATDFYYVNYCHYGPRFNT